MNAPIIAALITGSVSLLIWWLTHRSKSATAIQQTPIQQVASNTTQKIVPVRQRTTDLTHKQIADSIDAVLPLQQQNIEKLFVGIYVCWRGKLFSASRHGDKTSVSLSEICSGLVHCYAASYNCDDLITAHQRTEIIVRGKIKQISTYGAILEDCTFEIPKKLWPNAT